MDAFLASQIPNKEWRGRCMWSFEDGGPALRYGEGVDLLSERSVCVKFQALLSKKDGSYSYSRQHSIGYPIPTAHPPDPSNWPVVKVRPHPTPRHPTPLFPPFYICSLLLVSLCPASVIFCFSILYSGRGISVMVSGPADHWSPFKRQGIQNKVGVCMLSLAASAIDRMARQRIRYAFCS